MPVQQREITFCVKTFNRPNLLFRCLRSLHWASPESQIVVVDDSTIEYQYPADVLPHIRVIRTEPNIGVCAGRNRSIAAAETKFCFLLDDDHGLQKRSRWRESLEAVPDDWLNGIVAWPINHGRRIKAGYELIRQHTERGWKVAVSPVGSGPAELVVNNFLAPVDVMRQHPWPERLMTVEHFVWAWDMLVSGNSPPIHAMPNQYAWLHMRHAETKSADYRPHRKSDAARQVEREELKARGVCRIAWVHRLSE